MNPSVPLSEANQRWHQFLDDGYQGFLESLTALELATARHQWQQFKQSLSTHIEFEQQHIEPLAQDWEDNIHKLIQADHRILNRLMPRLDKALDTIEQSAKPRSQLVHSLDSFIKMRNVLVHHDQREMEYLYPMLDQKLDIKQTLKLAEAMDTQRASLSGLL